MTNKKILSHEWLVSKMLENPKVKAEVERLSTNTAKEKAEAEWPDEIDFGKPKGSETP